MILDTLILLAAYGWPVALMVAAVAVGDFIHDRRQARNLVLTAPGTPTREESVRNCEPVSLCPVELGPVTAGQSPRFRIVRGTEPVSPSTGFDPKREEQGPVDGFRHAA